MASQVRDARGVGSITRRGFIGATAAGLMLSVAPVAAWSSPAAGIGSHRTGAPAGLAGSSWLDRDYVGAELASHPDCWYCASSGATLELDAGGIRLDEPGWGQRRFPLAALREGHPQEAVRRVFGHTVAEELCRTVEAIAGR